MIVPKILWVAVARFCVEREISLINLVSIFHPGLTEIRGSLLEPNLLREVYAFFLGLLTWKKLEKQFWVLI